MAVSLLEASKICSLLTEGKIDELRKHGIKAVHEFIYEGVEICSKNKILSSKDAFTVYKSLLVHYSAFPQTAAQLYDDLIPCLTIHSTGFLKLDAFLDGGIYNGEITEIVGPSPSGKTQLCFSVCATLATETPSHVLFVDTLCNFSAKRIHEILKSRAKTEDTQMYMERIHLISITDSNKLIDFLEHFKFASAQPANIYSNIKMIIIDNFDSLFSVLSDNQFVLANTVQLLKYLSSESMLTVIVTNNMFENEPNDSSSLLGHFWKHVPSLVMHLKPKDRNNLEQNLFEVSLVKSARKETPSFVDFYITSKGLQFEEMQN